MPENAQEKSPQTPAPDLRTMAIQYLGLPADQDPKEYVRGLQEEATRLRGIETEKNTIQAAHDRLVEVEREYEAAKPLIEDGRSYRADLTDRALAEGVRAYGDHFSADIYKGILSRASIAEIKRFIEDWSRVANDIFTPGRKTHDESTPLPNESRSGSPAAAYAG